MRHGARVSVVIPALNEEATIGSVISAIPDWIDEVVVVDNGSTDTTAEKASAAGARVEHEPRRGYGAACLRGIAALRDPDVIVFIDADLSDYPEEMARLVDPVARDRADMVIGSRVLGPCEPGALAPMQRFGNGLSCFLMRLIWRTSFTDLGPFRAIGARALARLGMEDRDFGWTVEMQVKAARAGLRSLDVPVSYRNRAGGKSKVSGNVKGSFRAGKKILYTIFREAVAPRILGRRTFPSAKRLAVFTRWPEPGKTKTRLIGALGDRGAALLQRRMTEHTLRNARRFARGGGGRTGADVDVWFAGGSRARMRRWLGPGLRYVRQADGDLGERMSDAFDGMLASGAERAVIIGTDCPAASPDVIANAFRALGANDVVLGPADDGGYYLIGMKRPTPALFRDIAWGTRDVLAATLEKARGLGLKCALLDPLADVDRPGDLRVWEEASGPAIERMSIIIPTLNAAGTLPRTLQDLSPSPTLEVIVVDGGSTDETRRIAADHGTKVIASERGRASQMNAGAREATGDVLVFLHADTRLPDDFHWRIDDALGAPGVVAGAFGIAIDAPGPALRVVERGINFRALRMQMPYGDQAIFMRREAFQRAGGFPEIPLMEDFELVRRLRRLGRVRVCPARALTSGSRWLRLGCVRTTLMNWTTTLAYLAGVPPEKLARRYYGAG